MSVGQQIWEAHFKSNTTIAAPMLEIAFPSVASIEGLMAKVLYLVDFENQGTITKDNFIKVVNKFGSFDRIAHAISDLFEMNGFFGFITQENSAQMLRSENNEEGMFVIRLNPLEAPTTLSIDYIQYLNMKTAELVYHPSEQMWEVVGGGKYATVVSCLTGIGSALRRAYYRQFPKLGCFYFDSNQATKVLKAGSGEDYLFRFSSSTANAITACITAKDGKVTQIQITLQPLGKYLPSGGKEYESLDAMFKSSWFKAKNPINKKTRALPSSAAQVASSGAQVKPSTEGYNVFIEPATTSGVQRAASSRGVLNTLPTRAPSVSGLTPPTFATDANSRTRAATSDDLREAMSRYTTSDVDYDTHKLDASTDAFPAQSGDDSFPVVASPRKGGDDDSFPVVSDDAFPVMGPGTSSHPHLRQTVSAGNLNPTYTAQPSMHRTSSVHQPVPAGARPVTGFPRPSSPSPPPKPEHLSTPVDPVAELTRLLGQLSAAEVEQLSKLQSSVPAGMNSLKNVIAQAYIVAKAKKS